MQSLKPPKLESFKSGIVVLDKDLRISGEALPKTPYFYGINGFEFCHEGHIGLRLEDGALRHTSSGGLPSFDGSRMGWMEIPDDIPGLQWGNVSGETGSTTSLKFKVRFQKPFTSVPKISAWLTGFNCTSMGHTEMEVKVTQANKDGFVFLVKTVTWNMEVFAVSGSWIAFDQSTPGIAVHQYSFSYINPSFKSLPYVNINERHHYSENPYGAQLDLGASKFRYSQTVFLALTRFFFHQHAPIRLRVEPRWVSPASVDIAVFNLDDTLYLDIAMDVIAIGKVMEGREA